MPKINLNIDTKTFNEIYVKDGNLTDYSKRFEVYFGSRCQQVVVSHILLHARLLLRH